MRILRQRSFEGPNVHHHLPVLVTEIDLEHLAGRETREFPGLNDAILTRLPGLRTHTCGAGHAGAFVERLQGGTYFGHVVEHVAIELSGSVGIGVNYGKTRLVTEPSTYAIVVRCRNQAGMSRLIQIAMELVSSLLDERDYPLDEALEEVRRVIGRTSLGPSTASIVNAAQRRGIPVRRLDGEMSVVQLGYGRHRRLIQAAFTDHTSGVGAEIASDKHLTKTLLRNAFIPVPEGTVVDALGDARRAWEALGCRVVVKPLDGNQGRGVTMDVDSEEALSAAFERACQVSRHVVIEQQYGGHDYRVLAVNGRVVAASLRKPPEVVGDGSSTVAELIDRLNADPRRGDGHEKPLTRVDPTDPVLVATISRQTLTLDSRPESGRVIRLRESANLSTGGSATDVTDALHPSVRQTCERAARIVGLDVCGLDVVSPDISHPFHAASGIIEVNAGPGLRMHHFPSAGTPRDVGGAIVTMLFPGGSSGRVPIAAITGTNGKTTVTRMIAHVLRGTGVSVGMTTTDGIYLNGRELACGDMTGPRSAHAILSDPAVEVAVLETARGGIVRGGLGYDWSDVGVLTNIQSDHIGQDGIESLEDLLHIKSLVIERVRDGGTVVLNADDPLVLSLAERPRLAQRRCRLALFSMVPDSFAVRRHVAAGGIAYVVQNGWIVELSRAGRTRLANVSAIPVTFSGAAVFNVANALAAVATCRALGTDAPTIGRTLARFDANGCNGGRLNLFRLARGRVIVDYGHNPAAFEAIGGVAAKWRRSRVVGVVGVPGDRHEAVMREAARALTRTFDALVVKEDDDTRGRPRGEVASILCQTIRAERPNLPCTTVLDEREAVRVTLARMQQDDVVVVFYDQLAPVLRVLAEFDAVPVEAGTRASAGTSQYRS